MKATRTAAVDGRLGATSVFPPCERRKPRPATRERTDLGELSLRFEFRSDESRVDRAQLLNSTREILLVDSSGCKLSQSLIECKRKATHRFREQLNELSFVVLQIYLMCNSYRRIALEDVSGSRYTSQQIACESKKVLLYSRQSTDRIFGQSLDDSEAPTFAA